MFKNYILLSLCVHAWIIDAQTKPLESSTNYRGLTSFPELIMTAISGAPVLSYPVLVTGKSGSVFSQGHGLAAPAFYDMDGDGLKDLMIGEFGSGIEFGRYMGNFIRVYTNIGTEKKPEFEGRFVYARPPFRYQVQAHGTPYSVDQYCCMSFTPQFVDLDNDGYIDMITGQYQGEVSWFRGSEDGFIPGVPMAQDGNPRDLDKRTFIDNQSYWTFSSASFGDFTNDGLPDMIIGGRSLRISKNSGTKESPQFGKRDLLLDSSGNPLKVYEYTKTEEAEKKKWEEMTKDPMPIAGDYDLSPYVIDWDNDGITDLLVTNSYTHEGLEAVTFFKGIRIKGDHRFRAGVALFKAKDNCKSFPGSAPRIFVTDYNTDGINDLLIGASVVTIKNGFSDRLSWQWEKDTGILSAGKDPANLNENTLTADQLKRYKENIKLPEGVSIEEYMTLRHEGHIYVMLGGKPPESAPQPDKNKKTKRIR